MPIDYPLNCLCIIEKKNNKKIILRDYRIRRLYKVDFYIYLHTKKSNNLSYY